MKTLLRIIGICILFVANHNPIFGQNKFSFSISAAPCYTYSNTTSTLQYPLANNTILPVEVHDQQKGSGYSVGVLARYEFSTHFSVSTGIWLNHNHYNQPTINTNPDLSHYPGDIQVVGFSSNYRNYQIPLLVNYQSSTKRLSPYFSVGTYISLPYTKIFPEGTSTTPNQKIRLYPTVGAGIKYQLSNHFSLITQPTFTYLVPIRTYISYQYFQLSLQTQLLYKF